MITVFNTLKKGFVVNKSVDFRSRFMTLDCAKDILSRCVQVSNETIQFGPRVWSLILGDLEAIELLERAYGLGWNSNEPDISVVGDTGYDGRVYVNNAIMQLTQGTENTSVWLKNAAPSITSLAGFCMNSSSIIDSSAGRKIKRVRFGKNINTTNMTSCERFAEITSSIDQTKYEYFDVRHLNTANVTSFNRMFCINGEGSGYYTPYINGVENFDTGKCTDFRLMFYSLNFQNKTFDLRKWKVLSNANLAYIFGRLSHIPASGNNIKFYYRPSNWAKDPLDDNNISADQIKPVVYPYYPITVVSSAPSSQKIWVNNSSLVSMPYDSSNGVCYYNPSNGSITALMYAFFSDSSHNPTGNTVKSISFGQSIKNKLNSSASGDNITFAFLGACTLLRNFDATYLLQALYDMNKSTMGQLFIYSGGTTSGNTLRQVWGTEVINNVSCSHNSLLRGQQGMRFVELGENVTSTDMIYAFRNNTNLVRINNLPAIPTGIRTTSTFEGCTSLTTIDTAGDITESIDFSSCPLNLASAKVILNALKTVTSETISFSDTTWAAILNNVEAVELLEAAYAKGWSSNEPDITVIANSGYNGVVRVNAADKQLTQVGSTGVWIGSAGTVTSFSAFLKHATGTYYNSTSTNVKKVRFGKNINTTSCTTLVSAFDCSNSSTSNLDTIDVTHLNTSSCTNLSMVFANIVNPTTKIIGVENWNTSNASNFTGCFGATFYNDLDLHKWHVKSGATITGMFGSLATPAAKGVNTVVYYTPGYWAVEPITTLAADRKKPTVYPYHDITVASNLTSGQKIYLDDAQRDMTYDSTLGIWYYDLTNNQLSSMANMFRSGSNYNSTANNVLSVSFGKNIASKINYSGVTQDFLFAWKPGANNMKSADLSNLLKAINDNNSFNALAQCFIYAATNTHGASISNIYGLDKIQKKTSLRAAFRGCESLRYIDLNTTENIYEPVNNNINYAFYYCANLMRIKCLPGIPNGTSTTSAFEGCTALTAIDAIGDITETISFSDSPLNLGTAKRILNALKTVSGKTCTFSSTTKGYINADSEALSLVTAARGRGWTIPLT